MEIPTRDRTGWRAIGCTAAALMMLPSVASAGGPHGRSHAGAGRAPGVTAVRPAGSVRGFRPPIRIRPRATVIFPVGYTWYGAAYPYETGAPYPGAMTPAPADYPPPQSPSPPEQAAPEAQRNGWLALRLEPGTAQVYVDGFYAGEVSDFDVSGGRAIEPGPHHVELRAAGYQTSAFDVRLQPDQPVVYRENLRPIDGAEPPRGATASTSAPTTRFYVIARCYMGNVPPDQAALPEGCDPSQVKTIEIRR